MVTREQPKVRKVTAAYDDAAYRERRYAQEWAAQLRNHVVECRLKLERVLQETTKKQNDDDRR